MRKLLTVCAVIISLLLCSCLKKIENTPPSPVAPGIEIYNYTRLTTMASIDPVNVAIRLNLLLDAAFDDGDLNYERLATLKVGDVLVQSYLFDKATLAFDATEKIWTITYPGHSVTKDNIRSGKVIITTNGKRLSDNGSWAITTDNLKLSNYPDMYGTFYQINQGSRLVKWFFSE